MNKMLKVTTELGTAYMTAQDTNANDFEMFVNKLAEENNLEVEIKSFRVGKMPLEELPDDVQQQVKETLKAYDRCSAKFENQRWSATTGYCIKSSYSFDYFVAGEYYATDVYTEEERRQNFLEVFGYERRF